ncbi:hypothetical protein [Tessaracoccus rhinocerotis]|nr:hypothetical protein [Tessaracoccus rhinocerotis]
MAVEVRTETRFEGVQAVLGPRRPTSNVWLGFPRILRRHDLSSL